MEKVVLCFLVGCDHFAYENPSDLIKWMDFVSSFPGWFSIILERIFMIWQPYGHQRM